MNSLNLGQWIVHENSNSPVFGGYHSKFGLCIILLNN